MIIKEIVARCRPGAKEEFLDKQRVWNEAMMSLPGFLWVHVATDDKAPDDVAILVGIRSPEDLHRFMAREHDTIERRTGMRALYEHLDVRILDVVDSAVAGSSSA